MHVKYEVHMIKSDVEGKGFRRLPEVVKGFSTKWETGSFLIFGSEHNLKSCLDEAK